MVFKKIKSLLRDDSGAAMVLMAMGMVVFLGCMALVIDAGMFYSERSKASNAMDAAVLAGAQELLKKPGDTREDNTIKGNAQDVAEAYARDNGLEGADFEVSTDLKSITGTVGKPMGSFFARVLGINTWNVKADATAQVGPVGIIGTGTGLVPIGVTQQDIIDNKKELKEGGGTNEQGWYGCLDLDSLIGSNGGSSSYEHYLTFGYDGDGELKLGEGTLILEENGNMSGGTGDGIAYRINKCLDECDRECTATNYDPDCPRVVIVPVGYMTADNKHFEVTTTAAFFLYDIPGNGVDSIIRGEFLNYYYLPGGEIDNTVTDNGVYTIQLVD